MKKEKKLQTKNIYVLWIQKKKKKNLYNKRDVGEFLRDTLKKNIKIYLHMFKYRE